MGRNGTKRKDDANCYNAHLEQFVNNDPDDENIAKYYDWAKTLSFDADVTMVIGARGVGKTYGLRKQFIKDFLKHGWRFVEICRYKNEISSVASGYFNRIDMNNEYPGYIFKTTPQKAYIAKVEKSEISLDEKSKKKKTEWYCIGYFISLSDAQSLKKRTFSNVRRICFDEAILDKRDRFHKYLQSEYMLVANVIDTVSRERPDDNSLAPRLYLLGNALDLFNPYFEKYGITDKPERGYSWHKNKTMLLDYVESREYSESKLKGTVSGRMIDGTVEGEIQANNEFMTLGIDFIMKKTQKATFVYGISYKNNKYGIWTDMREGWFFVTDKFPRKTDRPIFTLTASDARLNYIMAKRMDKPIAMLSEAFYMGIMRFDSVAIMNGFIELMTLFGVKR